VLDLTRVIAGPVATRYLAALGADVLRLDPPHRPELPLHARDGLLGKRSAVLDFGTPDGSARWHELLSGADVVVHGYRPHALDRFGLSPEALAERHPGLVVVSLSAALPASRSRDRLPVRGRRAARTGRAGLARRHLVPRAQPGPDRALAARPAGGGRGFGFG
jgi:crotonobetainyl-CoA:carnitine CoA-transferase CaiB-like acyl-CoA transferase